MHRFGGAFFQFWWDKKWDFSQKIFTKINSVGFEWDFFERHILPMTQSIFGLDDAKDEMIRLEELEQARKEIDKTNGEKPMKQIMFKAI